MIKSYAEWILRWRWLVILATLISVGLLASGGRFLSMTNDYRVFFSEDNPQLAAFENLQDTYTKTDNVLIMLLPKDGNAMSASVAGAVTELTEAAWQIPYSIRVDSVSNFQHTYAEEDDLVVIDLIEEPRSLPANELAAKGQIAIEEPLLLNRLISGKQHATGVNVTIELPGINPTAEVPEVVTHVREMMTGFEAKYPDIEFYVTGAVMLNNAFPEASIKDIKTLIPLALGAIVIGLIIFLRTVSAMTATVFLIFMSIFAAMGSAGWLGIQLTPPAMSAPTMILTLAVADAIHFLSTMLFRMRHGDTKHDAIVESLRINFHPIFLTSLTTAIGFLSMNFSDAPPFRDLGNITAMGVVFAFILSVTFLPALISVLPVKAREGKTRTHRIMDSVAEFVIRRRTPLLFGIGALILIFSALVPRNDLNDNFVQYFDESIKFRTDTDKVADNLTGLYSIDYSMDSKEPGGISEPAFLQQIEDFANWYRTQPETKHVSVITDVFKRLNQNMHADDPGLYKIPDQRDLAAQYLLLYEMSLPYGLDLNNQINIDKSATRVSVTLETITTTQALALEERAQAWMTENTPNLVTPGASPTIMFSHIGMRNIKSMLTGTSVALVLISLALIFALRSFKLGMLSLVPNLAPALVAFGVWWIVKGEIGLALSVVAAMTLGIVVDDTVHFLSKYVRARREQGLNAEDAVRYAFSSVGVALWVTTMVLIAGFLVLSRSAFELNSSMGLMTAITIGIALFIDFFFLPPLLMRLDKGSLSK
ncbi:MAG TPA: RND transporter [Gammaproteobacteria bacterium]|nr:RND transporter [Gammaproteobacteria bacterium]